MVVWSKKATTRQQHTRNCRLVCCILRDGVAGLCVEEERINSTTKRERKRATTSQRRTEKGDFGMEGKKVVQGWKSIGIAMKTHCEHFLCFSIFVCMLWYRWRSATDGRMLFSVFSQLCAVSKYSLFSSKKISVSLAMRKCHSSLMDLQQQDFVLATHKA